MPRRRRPEVVTWFQVLALLGQVLIGLLLGSTFCVIFSVIYVWQTYMLYGQGTGWVGRDVQPEAERYLESYCHVELTGNLTEDELRFRACQLWHQSASFRLEP